MKDYKELNVWHKAHENVLGVYRLTKNFPKEEQFGLTSQLRRAIISVANNIVEGCGKHTDKDFVNFLQIVLVHARNLNIYLCFRFNWNI